MQHPRPPWQWQRPQDQHRAVPQSGRERQFLFADIHRPAATCSRARENENRESRSDNRPHRRCLPAARFQKPAGGTSFFDWQQYRSTPLTLPHHHGEPRGPPRSKTLAMNGSDTPTTGRATRSYFCLSSQTPVTHPPDFCKQRSPIHRGHSTE